MSTLFLMDIKHKLKTQDIFRGKTVKALVAEIDTQAARIAELETAITNLCIELPNNVIDEMRDTWGNTIANCIQRRRDEARATLSGGAK